MVEEINKKIESGVIDTTDESSGVRIGIKIVTQPSNKRGNLKLSYKSDNKRSKCIC